MTPAQFDIYLAQKEAKQARAKQPDDYQLLCWRYELGEISKAEYDQAVEKLVCDIEIKL